jgi:hypothetical protein
MAKATCPKGCVQNEKNVVDSSTGFRHFVATAENPLKNCDILSKALFIKPYDFTGFQPDFSWYAICRVAVARLV